jgi:hypothetical protein
MRTALFVTARTMLCESWDVRVLRQLESTACVLEPSCPTNPTWQSR